MPRNDLIQVRSDTSSNWTSVNPILATGEIGFESNTGKFKIGTGSTAWSSLPYTSDTAGFATTAGSATTAGTVTTAAQPAITSAVNLTSVGTLTSLNVAGTATASTTIMSELRAANGDYLVINVGDSNNYATGQASELLYVNAESGLQVNSSPDNWDSLWAGRNTATICAANGSSSFPGTVTAPLFSGSGASLTSIPNSATTATSSNDFSTIVSRNSGGNFSAGTITASLSGNATSADKADTWTTARTLSLTGNVTGSVSINGSANVSITTNIAANTVTASEIASSTITNSEISTTAAIALSKLATTGTMTATTFSGSGSSLTSIPAGQLTGTVNSAVDVPASTLTGTISTSRISGAYNGITDIGTLSSGLSVTTNILATGDIILSTGGTEFVATAPTVGGSSPANWVLVGSQYRLYRSSSTKDHKENIQNLGTYLTPDMIDPINIQLWNRKTAPGIPEVGPMAEDMHDISPFLSSRGMIWDENGEPIPSPVDGINNNSWMSLLTIGMQDIRQRLAKLENPEV